MKKCLWIAAAFIAVSMGAVEAQQTFTLKLGAGMPMGDFGDVRVRNNDVDKWALMDKSKLGGAGTGFNLGVEVALGRISSVPGLDVTLSADVFYNGLNTDLKEFFDDFTEYNLDDDNVRDFSMTTPVYLNIPVMLAARYSMQASPNIGVYGEAGIGANMRIITDFIEEGEYYDDYNNRYEDYEYKQEYYNAFTFAFRLAAGVTFSKKYSVELGYYNLGAGKVKGLFTSGSGTKEKFSGGSVTPILFTLRLGVSF